MSEPGTIQQTPAVSETSATDLAARPMKSGGNPELVVEGPSVAKDDPAQPPEQGGPAGLEPTRYGDWERNGRCIDF